MMRHLRFDLTQSELIDWLNQKLRGRFDFLYLRFDFQRDSNVGYAFINFSSSKWILDLMELLETDKSLAQPKRSNKTRPRSVQISYASKFEVLLSMF
jgi:hypothetical protein